MKERLLTVLLFLLALATVWAVVKDTPNSASTPVTATIPNVSSEVIRLHILADSDSAEDQAIKLQIRDLLLPYLNATTLTASTKEEALLLLQNQCDFFSKLINDALSSLGADYTATVSVSNLYFPVRIYGSQTYLSNDAVIFPPGFYDSVQVILGKGDGHNWWCLAYPSLCFIDACYDYIPKDSPAYKQKLGTVKKSMLSELFYGTSETPLATEDPDSEVTIYVGSKLWELIKDFFTGK